MDTADISLTGSTAHCTGHWTAQMLDDVERRIAAIKWPTGPIRFDLSKLEGVDTVGAWLVYRASRSLRGAGHEVSFDNVAPASARLLELVESKSRIGERAVHVQEH